MKGLKGLLGNMMDNEGIFQGGDEGRLFGRAKDALGIASKTGLFGDKETRENVGSELYKNQTQEGNDQLDLMSHAREFAKNLDSESGEDVLEMQGMLNQLGYKDDDGKELVGDGMFGEKTLSALRRLQGVEEGVEPGNDVESNKNSLFDRFSQSGNALKNAFKMPEFKGNKYIG